MPLEVQKALRIRQPMEGMHLPNEFPSRRISQKQDINYAVPAEKHIRLKGFNRNLC